MQEKRFAEKSISFFYCVCAAIGLLHIVLVYGKIQELAARVVVFILKRMEPLYELLQKIYADANYKYLIDTASISALTGSIVEVV